MLLLKPEDIKAFLQCKEEEIESIIQKNLKKSPLQIAKVIITDLNYSKLPLGLLKATRQVDTFPVMKKKEGRKPEPTT